ncbi:MmcQ/YjbR family DNA-binding protein [Rhodohalobacter sp. 614A]|uniref:MmcQ/YjbR family DNA-binding protein n=1 Tax=Rhodohalobacter sp. 614A TaxID=2908649 RepID=UPI001F224B17|nr:MmcQ/YjbR family DNA-binding protein [Rhodohalobacter sp. 614A]
MNIEEFRDFCLSFNGVTEEFPFDNNTLVFKVMGKMFALCDVDEFESINLKCEPVHAIQLREEHPGTVLPGYHMNKKHWNTVMMDNHLSNKLIEEWVTDSYNLVVANLPKKDQQKLKNKD